MFGLWILRHELHHARQIETKSIGDHTDSFEQMIEFELEAYSTDANWLSNNKAALEAITGLDVAAMPKNYIDYLITEVNQTATKFSAMTNLTDEIARLDELSITHDFLPVNLNGVDYTTVKPLYETAPPP